MASISLITIGDELLKGRIVNTNASKAGLMLRTHGFSFHRVVTISDTREDIRDTVKAELDAHDIVIMCGGLGPTQDDITKPTLAELFESEMEWHAPTMAYLERRYSERGRELDDRSSRQALVPAVAEVLPNPMGTAPGMAFAQDDKLLFSLPGVPFEFFYLLENEVIPKIKSNFDTGFFDHHIIRILGVPESRAALWISELEAKMDPEVALAFLPRNDGLWLEFSVREERKHAAMLANAALVKKRFGEHVYTEGSRSAAAMLIDDLKQKGQTIAIAESLTGGNIAAKLVAISGASEVFTGSVTAYDVRIKIEQLGVDPDSVERHTVVSEAVVKQMAEGVRKLLGTDYGIASTGIAQAGGELPTQAWLGFADKNHTDAEFVRLLSDRQVNIERASERAIILAYKKLQSQIGVEANSD
ncbi:MAG: CinA family nicotinamide mononucleotide deamidase-related protein [Bacteroidota bacterium]